MAESTSAATSPRDKYALKLADLQKHVPFIQAMIGHLKGAEDKSREGQLAKMESLHSMITDTQRKWKYEILLKCEEVIVKLKSRMKSNILTNSRDGDKNRSNKKEDRKLLREESKDVKKRGKSKDGRIGVKAAESTPPSAKKPSIKTKQLRSEAEESLETKEPPRKAKVVPSKICKIKETKTKPSRRDIFREIRDIQENSESDEGEILSDDMDDDWQERLEYFSKATQSKRRRYGQYSPAESSRLNIILPLLLEAIKGTSPVDNSRPPHPHRFDHHQHQQPGGSGTGRYHPPDRYEKCRYNDFGRFENRTLSPAIGGFARWKAERNWKTGRFESKARKKLQHSADKKAYELTTFKRRPHKKNAATRERQEYEDVSGGELEAEEEEGAEEEEEEISLDEVSNSSTLVADEKEDGECEDEEDDKLVIDMSKCSGSKDDLKFAGENRVKIERTFSDDSSSSLIIGERRPFSDPKRRSLTTKSNVKSRLGYRNYQVPRVNFETRKISGTERVESPRIDVREDTKPALPSSESLTAILQSLQSIKSESESGIGGHVREPMTSRKEGFSLAKIDIGESISEKTMSKADMSAIIEEVKRLIAAEDMRVKSEKSKFSNEESSILDPIRKDKVENSESNFAPTVTPQTVAVEKSNNLAPIKTLKTEPPSEVFETTSVPIKRLKVETPPSPRINLSLPHRKSPHNKISWDEGGEPKTSSDLDLPPRIGTTPSLENSQSKAYRGTTPKTCANEPLAHTKSLLQVPRLSCGTPEIEATTSFKPTRSKIGRKSMPEVIRKNEPTKNVPSLYMFITAPIGRSKSEAPRPFGTGRKSISDGLTPELTKREQIPISKNATSGKIGPKEPVISKFAASTSVSCKSKIGEATSSEICQDKSLRGPLSKDPRIKKPPVQAILTTSKSEIDKTTSSDIYPDNKLTSKDFLVKKSTGSTIFLRPKSETSSEIYQDKSSPKLAPTVKKPIDSTSHFGPKSEIDRATSSDILSSQKLASKDPRIKKPVEATLISSKSESDKTSSSVFCQNTSSQKLGCKDSMVRKHAASTILLGFKSEIDEKTTSSAIHEDKSSPKLTPKDSTAKNPVELTIPLGAKFQTDKTTSSEIYQDKTLQKLTPKDSTVKKPVESTIPLGAKFQTDKTTSSEIYQDKTLQKLTPKDSTVNKPIESTILLGAKFQTDKTTSLEIHQNKSSQKLTPKDSMAKKPVESTTLLRLKAETSKATSSETCQEKSLERSASKDHRIKKPPVEATLITFKSEIDKTTSSEIHEDKFSKKLMSKDPTVKKPVNSITFLGPKSEIGKTTSSEICQDKSSQKLVSKDPTVMKPVESTILLGAKSEIDTATSSETCQDKFSQKFTPGDSTAEKPVESPILLGPKSEIDTATSSETCQDKFSQKFTLKDCTAKKPVESTILFRATSETDKATSSEIYQDKSSQKLLSKASTMIKICANEAVREKPLNSSGRVEKTVPINKVDQKLIPKDFKPNKISTDDLPKEKESSRMSSKSYGKSQGERTMPVKVDQNKIERKSTPETLPINEPGEKSKVDKKLLTEVDQGKIDLAPNKICVSEPAKGERPSQTTLGLCDKSKGVDQNIIERKTTSNDLHPNNIWTNDPAKEKGFAQATLGSCEKSKEVDQNKVEQFRDPPANKICSDESAKQKDPVQTTLNLRDKSKEIDQKKVEQKPTSRDPRANKTCIDESTKQTRSVQTALGLRDNSKEVDQSKVEQKPTSRDPRSNKTCIDESTKQRRSVQTTLGLRDNSKEVDQSKVEQKPTSRDPRANKTCIDESTKQRRSAQTILDLRDNSKGVDQSKVEQKPTSRDPRANKTCIDESTKQRRSAQTILDLRDNSKEVDQNKVEQKLTSGDPPPSKTCIVESEKQRKSTQTTLGLRDKSKEAEQKPTSGDPPPDKNCIDELAKQKRSAQTTLGLRDKSKEVDQNKVEQKPTSRDPPSNKISIGDVAKQKRPTQGTLDPVDKSKEVGQNKTGQKSIEKKPENLQNTNVEKVAPVSIESDLKMAKVQETSVPSDSKGKKAIKSESEKERKLLERANLKVETPPPPAEVRETSEVGVKSKKSAPSVKDEAKNLQTLTIPPVTGQVPKPVTVENQANKTGGKQVNLAKNKIQDGVVIEKKAKDRPETPETYTKYDRMYSSLAKMGASAPSLETLYSEESTTKSFKIPKRQIQAPPLPPPKPVEPSTVEVERSNSKGFRRIVPVEALESKEEGAVVVKAKSSKKDRKRKAGKGRKSARITDDSDEEPDSQNEAIQKQERDKDGDGKERKLPLDEGKSKKAEVEDRKEKPQVAADESSGDKFETDSKQASSSGTSKTVEVKEANAVSASGKEEAKESEKSAVEEERKDQPSNSTDLLEFILKNYKQIKKIFKNDDSSDDESHSRKRRKKKKKHKRRHSSSSSEDERVKEKQSKLAVLARKERSATPSDKEVGKKKCEVKPPPRSSDVPAKELPATSTDKDVPKRKSETKPVSAKVLPVTSDDKDVPKRKPEAKSSSAKVLPATSGDKKKPPQESKPRRNELDILHEDIKDMWMSGDIISATGRRACTVNKEQLSTTAKVAKRPETFDRMIEKAAGLRVRLRREDLHGLLSKIKNQQGQLDSENDTKKGVDENETSPLPSQPRKRRRRPCPKSVRKYIQDDREVTPVKEGGKPDEVIEDATRMQLRSGSPPRKRRRRPCPKSAIKYIQDDREVRENDADEIESRPPSPPRKRKRTDSARSNHTPIQSDPESSSLHSEDGASSMVAFRTRRSSSSSVSGLHNKEYYVQKEQMFCLLCNYIGKRISYHYKIMHKEHEVLSSRLSSRVTALLIADSKRRGYEKIDLGNGVKRRHNFVCPFCSMNILDFTANFHHHLTSHTCEFSNKCEQCDYESLELKSMRRHSRKHHGGVVKFTTEAPPPNSNVVFGFVCLECHYLQISKGKLDSHVVAYHANKAEILKINLNFIGLDNETVEHDVDAEADVDVDVEGGVDVDVNVEVDVGVDRDVEADVEVSVEPDVQIEEIDKGEDATLAGKDAIDTDVQVKIEPSILSDVKLESESNQSDANPATNPIKLEAVSVQDDNRRDETGLSSQNVWDDVTAQTVQWTIDQSDLIASETDLPERPAPKCKPSRLFVSENEERGEAMGGNAPTSSRSSPSSPLALSAVAQTKSAPISNIINRLQDNLQPGSSAGPIVLNKMLNNKDETIPSLIYYTKLLGTGKASPVGDLPLSIEHQTPCKTYKPAKKITAKVVSIGQNPEKNDDRPPPLSHYKDLQTKRRADAVLHVGPIKLLRSECGTIFYACFVARCIFCSDKEEVFGQHCLTTHERVTGNWWCQPCRTTLHRVTLHELFVHVNQLHAPTLERKPKTVKRSVGDSRSSSQSASTSAMSGLENFVNGGSNVLESKHKSVASDSKPSSKEFPSNREIPQLLDDFFDLTASSPEDNASISASEPYGTLDGAAPSTSIPSNIATPLAGNLVNTRLIDGASTSANPLPPSLPVYREYHPKRASALPVVETIDVDSLPDLRTQPSATSVEGSNAPIRKEYIRTVPLSKLLEDDTSATTVAPVPPDHPVQAQNATMQLSSAYVGYSYKCPVFNCFFSSDNQHDFAVHVFRHPNCYVSCLHCRSLIQLSLYTEHLTHTHFGHQYVCPYCPYRASCGAYVRAHMETEHKMTAEVPLSVQSVLPAGPHVFRPYPSIPDLVKPYVCSKPECELETIFTKTILSHRRMMQRLKTVFRCGYCGVNLQWPGLNHFVKHGLHPIHCRYCPFGTQGLECAIRHLAENHSSLPFCLLLRIDRFTGKDRVANKDEYWRMLIASEKMIMSKYSYSDETAENKILPNLINKQLQSIQTRSPPKDTNETSVAIDEDLISDQSTPSTSKDDVAVLPLTNEDSSNDDYTFSMDAEEHPSHNLGESENTAADYTDGTVYPSCNICGVLLLKIACPHLKVIKTDVQTEYITGKVNTSRITRSNGQEVVEKSRLVAEGIVQPHYVKDGRFKCGGTNCKRILDNAHNLRTHLQQVHSSDVVYSCHHCTVVFNFRIREFDVDMLVKHASLHEQTIYRCKYCYFVDNLEENMYLHLFDMHPASRVRYFKTTRDEGDDVNLLLEFPRLAPQDDSTSFAETDEIEAAPSSSNTQDLNDREMAEVGATDMYLLRMVVSDTQQWNANKGFVKPCNRGKKMKFACPNCDFTTKRAIVLHNHLMDKADVIKRQYLDETADDKRLIEFIHQVIRYQVRIWNYSIDTVRGKQRECRFCPQMCSTIIPTVHESSHLVGWSSSDAFNPLQMNHPDDVPPEMVASVRSTLIRPVDKDIQDDLFLLEIMTYADLEAPERPPIDVWPKRCAYCGRTGTYRDLAIHHLIVHRCKKVLGFTFACGDCPAHFDTVQGFRAHNATTHGSKAMASANFVGVTCDECDTCGKKFRNRDVFDLHVKTHSSPYKCKYCDHSTYNRRLLRKHHFDRHNDEPFEFLYDFLSAPFPRKEKI